MFPTNQFDFVSHFFFCPKNLDYHRFNRWEIYLSSYNSPCNSEIDHLWKNFRTNPDIDFHHSFVSIDINLEYQHPFWSYQHICFQVSPSDDCPTKVLPVGHSISSSINKQHKGNLPFVSVSTSTAYRHHLREFSALFLPRPQRPHNSSARICSYSAEKEKHNPFCSYSHHKGKNLLPSGG